MSKILDVIDGHMYWQHPAIERDPVTGWSTGKFEIKNTPMVNEPFKSSVVELSQSAVADKPFTVSEINHPFPNEYACEGVPILGAYGLFQDWDGIFWYTFAHEKPEDWEWKIRKYFDLHADPIKMTNIATCALMFLRGDVKPALETVYRTYSIEQVYESIRNPRNKRSDFSFSMPLKRATRISSFSGPPIGVLETEELNPFVSDTEELKWYQNSGINGLVTIETELCQALIGFVKTNEKVLRNIYADVKNDFCSVILISLDDKPLSQSEKMLLTATARVANTGMEWKGTRTSLTEWGTSPTVIEPVAGTIALRNLQGVYGVEAVPINSTGLQIDDPISGVNTNEGWKISIGEIATTWYVINVKHYEIPSLTEFKLEQNYPNPFNPSTTIKYQVPTTSRIEIQIFNTLGQKIKTLINEEKSPGYYEVIWNGTNELGQKVSSGIYLYQLKANDFVETRKLVYIK